MKHSLQRYLTGAWGVGSAALMVGAALVAVGWLDYASARREFGALMRAQAASARDTVAAAARANRSAAQQARGQLAERLLDNARLLAEIDRRGGLTAATLEEIAARNHLFRVTVIAPDASREQFVHGERAGFGPGPLGGNPAGGTAGAQLLDRLMRDGDPEAVTDLHEGRRGGMHRIAAGVRRQNGGAILLSIDATAVANLQRQSSLDALLGDIVGTTEDIAYIVFEDGAVRLVQGGRTETAPPAMAAGAGAESERELNVEGRPVLELAGPIDIGAPQPATLRLGMRLDRLRTAERRTAARLTLSLAAASALGVLAIGLVWMRRRFGALSVEHALAQEALRRRDRLSAMGELASTVAHEIRNPLNAITMSAQRLQRECVSLAVGSPVDDAGELVEVIQREAQRMNVKVQQFLEYARPPRLNRQPVELATWLPAIVAAARPVADARHVSLVGETNVPGAVTVDAEQLRQALDNLVLNAIEATGAGGTVWVHASITRDELVLEVRDTGSGIDPADLRRIFDLYFTTKQGGTGVGLAVTQQIVSAHGGTVEVDSAKGRGTVMRIRIPLVGALAHA